MISKHTLFPSKKSGSKTLPLFLRAGAGLQCRAQLHITSAGKACCLRQPVACQTYSQTIGPDIFGCPVFYPDLFYKWLQILCQISWQTGLQIAEFTYIIAHTFSITIRCNNRHRMTGHLPSRNITTLQGGSVIPIVPSVVL